VVAVDVELFEGEVCGWVECQSASKMEGVARLHIVPVLERPRKRTFMGVFLILSDGGTRGYGAGTLIVALVC
jgi:hypothetical protein